MSPGKQQSERPLRLPAVVSYVPLSLSKSAPNNPHENDFERNSLKQILQLLGRNGGHLIWGRFFISTRGT